MYIKSATLGKLDSKLESARLGKECYRGKLNRCTKEFSTVNTDFNYKLATLDERHQLKIDGLDSEIVMFHGEMQALGAEFEEMRSKVRLKHMHTVNCTMIMFVSVLSYFLV